MKLQLSLFILLKYKLNGYRLPFGYRLVHNRRSYTHLGFGFFVIVLLSLRFQKIYNVTFLNNNNEELTVTLISKSQLKRYESLPGFAYTTKTIRKK